jgi:hypothetical protein
VTTESRIDAANEQMAAIADKGGDADKRERLRAIWQPIAFELIDKSFSGPGEDASKQLTADPNFVGVTCDTSRPVFLEKETSASGFVYRKFMLGERRLGN